MHAKIFFKWGLSALYKWFYLYFFSFPPTSLYLQSTTSFIGTIVLLWFITIKDLLTDDSWRTTNWRPLGNPMLLQPRCLIWDVMDCLSTVLSSSKINSELHWYGTLVWITFFFLILKKRLRSTSWYRFSFLLKCWCVSYREKMHHAAFRSSNF